MSKKLKLMLLLVVMLLIIISIILLWRKKDFEKYYKNYTVYDYKKKWEEYEEIIVRTIYWSAFWENRWSKETIKKLERKKEIPVYVHIGRISKEELKMVRSEPILGGREGNFLDIYIDELKSIIAVTKIEGQITHVAIYSSQTEREEYEYKKEETCPPCKKMKIRLKGEYKKIMDNEEKCKNSIRVKEIVKYILKDLKEKKEFYKNLKECGAIKEIVLNIGYFTEKYPNVYYKIKGINEEVGTILFDKKTNKLIYVDYKPMWVIGIDKDYGKHCVKKLDKYSFEIKIKEEE